MRLHVAASGLVMTPTNQSGAASWCTAPLASVVNSLCTDVRRSGRAWLNSCAQIRSLSLVSAWVRSAKITRRPTSIAVQPQEFSRRFEGPEYVNVTAVHQLIHARDAIVHIRVDYDGAAGLL